MNEDIRQNLVDAGCDEKFIKKFTCYMYDKKQCEKMLIQHRQKLLDEVHEKERNINCLDYLVYTMNKEKSE